MKEIIERALHYGPEWIRDLINLVSGPKTFLAQLDLTEESTRNRALLFWLGAGIVVFMSELPFSSQHDDVWMSFLQTTIFHLLAAVILAGLVKVGFALVGGKASFMAMFVLSLFISGVSRVIWASGIPVSKAIVRLDEPDQYAAFEAATNDMMSMRVDAALQQFTAIGSPTILVALFVSVAVSLAAFIWLIVAWGAYRQINEVTKRRSFFAFITVVLLQIPLASLMALAQRGLGITLF
jgi:hypothetical protein